MNYTKPTVAVLSSALDAVQATAKQASMQTDNIVPLATGPAYEADE